MDEARRIRALAQTIARRFAERAPARPVDVVMAATPRPRSGAHAWEWARWTDGGTAATDGWRR